MGDQWSEIDERRQQMQVGSRRLLILGAIVAGAFFAGTYFFGKPREEPAPVRALEAAIVPGPVIEAPQVIEPTRPTYRAPAGAPGRQTYVGVYECMVNGQRVVSDKPCGPDAQARTLVVDQPDPVEAARLRRETGVAGQGTAASTRKAANGGDTYCIYVRSRVTGETKAHTCRWFSLFQSCAEAAARIDGRCGLPRQ